MVTIRNFHLSNFIAPLAQPPVDTGIRLVSGITGSGKSLPIVIAGMVRRGELPEEFLELARRNQEAWDRLCGNTPTTEETP